MSRTDYSRLQTEQSNPRSARLDLLTAEQIIQLMNQEDRRVLRAVALCRKDIARAVELIRARLRHGGRLFFVGAGTSGRLGALEAAECPPTFNTSPQMVQAIMAGGRAAVFRSKEGAEDSKREATRAVGRLVRRQDAIVGVAASGVTPFVRAALSQARRIGAGTILVTCNPQSVNRGAADVRIALPTGPEVLAGSTRLKAGTACKMVLNMLTTGSMVGLGKVYGNWMVDLQPKSKKLIARGIRLVQQLAGVSQNDAQKLFRKAGGRVKVAIVMARNNVSPVEAQRRLAAAGGYLRKALK